MRGLAKGVDNMRHVDTFKLEAHICDCGAAGEPKEHHAKDCPWVGAMKFLLPPQSINSGLLEAAKETASFIRNCNGGSRGERINLDRLANLLEVAISNAEKAI